MASTIPLRDTWWFYVEELASLAKPASNQPSVSVDSLTISDKPTPEELDRLVGKVMGEKSKWTPFETTDRDLLEASMVADREAGSAVSGQSGQRLWFADFKRMEMSPMYWKGGSVVPLRRSKWIIMNSLEDDRQGGIPAPLSWEVQLERECMNQEPVIGSSDFESVNIDLTGVLANYQLQIKAGSGSFMLVPKPGLTVKSMLSTTTPKPIRLVRGYTAYYSTVVAAMKDPVGTLGSPTATGSSPAQQQSRPTQTKQLPSPFEEANSDPPRPPKHVIYVVHGIGQKLAEKVGHGFVSAVNSLRRYMLSYASQLKFDLDDIYILPIQWRVDLDMGSGYFAPPATEPNESEFDSLVRSITLPSVPAVRTLATDVTMDVLLYMTPRHFNRIVDACVKEIRRVHSLFLAHNKNHGETKFSFVGHSLGSALVFDILGFQLDHETADFDSILTCVDAINKRIGFEVENYFSLGSPLPLFMLLKHIKPIACARRENIMDVLEEAIKEYKSYHTESHPRMGFLACKQLYNLFMPYDPVAYRMEPLLVPPEYRHDIVHPKRVPYCKGGMTGLKLGVAQKLGQTKQDVIEAVNRSLPQWFKEKISSSPEQQQDPTSGDLSPVSDMDGKAESLLQRLNQTGRIDYQLQDSIMESAYLSSLSSHFAYWHDEDVANFILKQLIIPDHPS